ncbi:hypothetical protein A2U01_0079020, partial [Trifolium medium]|nr:hypothetical protein [Trifolium medium]
MLRKVWKLLCQLRVVQERMVRRAGDDGASRQSVRRMHQEPSVHGALRSFIWRVAHLHSSSR